MALGESDERVGIAGHCGADVGLDPRLGANHPRRGEVGAGPQRGDLTRGEPQHLFECLYGQTQGNPLIEQVIEPRGAARGLSRVAGSKTDDNMTDGVYAEPD